VGNQAPPDRLTRRWWSGPGLPIALGYPGAVTMLAAAGAISGRSWPILLAMLLTLPQLPGLWGAEGSRWPVRGHRHDRR
jgi:hypothetical protein